MPMINITIGPLEKEMKKEIIKKVTNTMVEITGVPEDKFMTAIHELSYDNLSLGTKTVSELLQGK